MVTTMIQRPKKLALVVALFIISIVISTYVSTSSSHGPSKFRTHLQQMPAYLRQKACLMSPFGVNQSSGFMEGAVSVNDIVRYSTKSSQGNYMPPEFVSSSVNQAPRVKAAFIVLVRNNELDGMIQSMNDYEFRFNRKFNYPWIFLNDEPFTDEFKTEVRKRTRAPTYFGLVPSEHWSYPDFIDQEKARQSRIDMDQHGVPYATSESYRHMCRFQSGFFF